MSRRKKVLLLVLAAALVLQLGAAALLTGRNLWEEKRSAQAAEQVLEQLSHLIPERPAASGTAEATPAPEKPEEFRLPAEMTLQRIEGRDYIGTLSVPELELTLPVMADWDETRLKIAPCRYAGSYCTDDLVIAGHNYRKHFTPLKSLPVGSELVFTTVDGLQLRYTLAYTEIIPEQEVEAMTAGTDWDLTLFTCTADSASRYTLRCVRENKS